MSVVFLLGRLLYGLLFARAAVLHLRRDDVLTDHARRRAVPMPGLSVPLTGAVCLLGAASVMSGFWADLGALLLIAFLISDALVMHPYWRVPRARRTEESMDFFKDLSLLGAALVILYVYEHVPDPPLSLGPRLFAAP